MQVFSLPVRCLVEQPERFTEGSCSLWFSKSEKHFNGDPQMTAIELSRALLISTRSPMSKE